MSKTRFYITGIKKNQTHWSVEVLLLHSYMCCSPCRMPHHPKGEFLVTIYIMVKIMIISLNLEVTSLQLK